MKKAECVEKYGVETWEKWLNQAKEWRKTHKQYTSEYGKEWAANNPKKVRGYKDKYYEKKKEEIITKNKETYQTFLGNAQKKSNKYKIADKERGFDISSNITPEWMVENIFSGQKCVYCGDSDWKHLGCDRIDNTKPHTPDNCIPCRYVCNVDRSDRYTVEEFKKYRSLHPRACDIPKGPAIQLSETGALKKRTIA